jgi:hypothetical protein
MPLLPMRRLDEAGARTRAFFGALFRKREQRELILSSLKVAAGEQSEAECGAAMRVNVQFSSLLGTSAFSTCPVRQTMSAFGVIAEVAFQVRQDRF